MRLRHPGVWLGIASALAVAWFVWSDRERVSPGPVSAAHAQEASLEQDCERCHGRPGEPLSSACADCHAPIAAQLAERRGFHGTLAGGAEGCGRCHSEHHGREFQLAGAASFALAGVADRDAYDHAGLGFALAGRHTALACRACHPHADDAVIAKGDARFLGLSQSCASCHEDPHAGQLPDCASCHGQDAPFDRIASFDHTAAFPLTGSHANLACARCHEKGSAHAVEVLANEVKLAGGAPPAPRECAACHPSPHTRAFVEARARAHGISADAACVECHRTEHASFAGEEPAMTREAHAASGFALEPPHAELDCRACHAPGSFAESHPGRSAGDCGACHEDPHAGQFGERGCLACHEPHQFRPTTFDVAKHARTSFPLTGSHAAVACDACHVQGALARVFHGTSQECSSCHRDAHAAYFGAAWQRQRVPDDEGCAHCHGTDTFGEVPAESFDHARWTRFPLEGAHAEASCEACHVPASSPDHTGRTFGRIAPHDASSPAQCGDCHADAHRGAFAAVGCAECHTPSAFHELSRPFDHEARTGFALEGAHARASCESCHPRTLRPDDTGRRFGRAKVVAEVARNHCRACHADAHQGAFDRAGVARMIDGRSGCLRCHTAESFTKIRPPGFDHAHWTGFALEGVHASLDCASCHTQSGTPASPLDVRFAKAAGSDCASCHADPHVGQFARAGRTDCARCHTSSAAFSDTRFDHARDSRFALDATHAKLACSACHLEQALPDGTRAVRYKPLGTSCGDCHDTRDGPR